MLRITVARCLVFMPRVDGAKSPASSSTARSDSSRRGRSFLVAPTNRTDPHTRPQPRNVRGGRASESQNDAYRSQRDAFRESIHKIGTTMSSSGRGGFSPVEASADPIQSPGEARQRHRRRKEATLPEDYYEAKQPTKADSRAQRMREIIRRNAVSSVEVSAGGEADIDMGGLPREAYHGADGWTTVPDRSALYQNIINKDALPSRRGYNSWSVLRTLQQQEHQQHPAAGNPVAKGDAAVTDDAAAKDIFLHTRAESELQWARHNGEYRATFENDVTLAPMRDAVAHSRSTYALRKLFLDGLCGYLNIITQHEELTIAEEVVHLTSSNASCYVAEEARYCVNLYDSATPLGVPTRDPLALPFSRCPTLQIVLKRLFDLELIPTMPNVVQISEFVGTFSGYPPHRKPHTIGPFLGILNLVSPGVVQMRHAEQPWAPRMLLMPRSLFVVQPPCLEEYAIGYAATHQPFHNFDYATRFAADYRIEILMATVDVQSTKLLRETVAMTEYANARLQLPAASGGDSNAEGSIDDAIHRLGRGGADANGVQRKPAASGETAKAVLQHDVGRAKPLRGGNETSQKNPAGLSRSRIMELKARHQWIQEQLRDGSGSAGDAERDVGVLRRVGGGNVIQGHKPQPRKL